MKREEFNQKFMKELEKNGIPLSERQVKKCVAAFLSTVEASVQEDGKISFSGFGSFEKVKRSARKGRNVVTGEVVEIEERMGIKFTPAKQFKETLQK